MTELLNTINGFPPWLVITGSLMVAIGLLLLVNKIILSRISASMKSNRWNFSTVVVNALKTPLTIIGVIIVVLLLSFLLEFYNFTLSYYDLFMPTAIKVLAIVAVVVFFERLSSGAISQYSEKSILLKNGKSIVNGLSKILILCIGALVLFSTLGISITPVIASLGIGSLAVALALQPTLENLFSGIQLIADKPFRVGDFIELDSGEQGFVEKIGWRSTWVKMLPNNMVVMPNSVLSESKIINYFYPEKELSVPVEVGVHYGSDLEFVEQVTLEVARHILHTHKWGVPEYDTFVVFHTFADSSINFTVVLRTREYFNRFFIKSEFIKALHKRYAEEGIVIPYPIRAINTEQEAVRFNHPDAQ